MANNIPGPNDTALTEFLAAVNAATTPAVLVESYFCPNGVDDDDNAIPTVGLTAYAPSSPSFTGQAGIISMFQEVFSAFQNFAFTQIADSSRLYSSDQSQIAIQAVMTGIQHGSWFPKGSGHFSQPISGIYPSGKNMNIPVCAVFVFDDDNQITNLSLFFDRYRMQIQLQ
jgi:hypothetical protein